MPEIVLYHHPMSRGRIARWMLEETGQPYRVELLPFNDATPTTGMGAAEFGAINPMRKVPTLTYGKTVVTEAAAICAWLADTFPEAGLAPPPHERAAYYRWLFFMAAPFEQAMTNAAMRWTPPPERERMMGYGSFERTIGAIEGWLTENTYITHDRFTAADVYVGSGIGYGMMTGIVPKRPAFEAYQKRLSARSAYVRATALDDALAKEIA